MPLKGLCRVFRTPPNPGDTGPSCPVSGPAPRKHLEPAAGRTPWRGGLTRHARGRSRPHCGHSGTLAGSQQGDTQSKTDTGRNPCTCGSSILATGRRPSGTAQESAIAKHSHGNSKLDPGAARWRRPSFLHQCIIHTKPRFRPGATVGKNLEWPSLKPCEAMHHPSEIT